MTRNDIIRALLHLPVGVVTVISVSTHWVIPLCFSLGFIVYELNEDMHLTDKAYKDIMGWLVGIGLSVSCLFILKQCGIIIAW